MKKYKIKLIKENHPPKYQYDVIKVVANDKYNYFEITTKIYHHEIIETKSYRDFDRIELYDEENKLVDVIKKGESI